MSIIQLRRAIKKVVDQLPRERLELLADFVAFLARPSLRNRIQIAEKALKAGKCVNWRQVRSDI